MLRSLMRFHDFIIHINLDFALLEKGQSTSIFDFCRNPCSLALSAMVRFYRVSLVREDTRVIIPVGRSMIQVIKITR
jgi:hypothetical protein